jgi:hypothetical protein
MIKPLSEEAKHDKLLTILLHANTTKKCSNILRRVCSVIDIHFIDLDHPADIAAFISNPTMSNAELIDTRFQNILDIFCDFNDDTVIGITHYINTYVEIYINDHNTDPKGVTTLSDAIHVLNYSMIDVYDIVSEAIQVAKILEY